MQNYNFPHNFQVSLFHSSQLIVFFVLYISILHVIFSISCQLSDFYVPFKISAFLGNLSVLTFFVSFPILSFSRTFVFNFQRSLFTFFPILSFEGPQLFYLNLVTTFLPSFIHLHIFYVFKINLNISIFVHPI
jgi:hypothetical protein